ncbi:MAG: ice-binding family protein [Candidatus Acidiferrales bacterium]
MRKLKFTKVWISAFLLAAVIAGCGDPDKNAGAGKPGNPLTPPSVISVNPVTGSTFTCGIPVVINATFSKAMNPATINSTTFTLNTGATSAAGVVTYNASTNVATFTPSAPLSPNSLYVATITTGAQDQYGNGLTANYFWSFTTSPACPPPTVTAVTPPNGSTLTCPNTAVITATFSHAMNPATINVTTFTLTGSGGASIAGAVTYVASTNIATFTPSAALSPSTLYTATITTGATDTFGIPLAANFVWTFTTSPVCVPPAGGIPLGAACSFGILGATPVVSSVGPTKVTGDIGIWPAASITGFPPGTFTGTEHLGDAIAMTAQGDLTIAYNNAAGAAGGAILPADIGGLTLAPGVYKTTSAQPSLGITGNLTLSGPSSGVWIFQVVSTLTTAAGNSQVIMAGGATSHNVFWQIGSSATLGTNTTFAGTIMAQASITVNTGATLNGRALARTGAVTLDSNPVNVPPCP